MKNSLIKKLMTSSLIKRLKTSSAISKQAEEVKCSYVLPKGENESKEKTIDVQGSTSFVRDMFEMLDVMVKSPTALKILKHNADLNPPLFIEEFKEALDVGRKTEKSIQISYYETKPTKKYGWLGLVPHEFRHSYNISPKSHILHAVAYAVANEFDAHAIGNLVDLELDNYLKEHKEEVPNAEAIREHLRSSREYRFFRDIYDKTNGTELQRKTETVETFIKEFSQKDYPESSVKALIRKFSQKKPEPKKFYEVAYKSSIERHTTKDGWIKCSDEELKKIEDCLLGKIKYEDIASEKFMQGRKVLQDERETIKAEWPTFCQRLMDGTYNTDVLPYGQNIKPVQLIQTIAPKLYEHLNAIGVIPSINDYSQAVGRSKERS
ncbi:MAG: hypothetical protein J6Y03_00395 [Alphaproteobacteria bacterium]|nr:hypothetical protein [Alphaproteobacteria bacterium]